MTPKSRQLLTAAGPLVLFVMIGIVMWVSSRPSLAPAPASNASQPASAQTTVQIDFQSLAAGQPIPEWTAVVGAFAVVDRDGTRALAQFPEPMAEGQFMWSKLMPQGGEIRARFQGERGPRTAPRFYVGLMGGDTHYQFRADPIKKVAQIVVREKELAGIPWLWKPEAKVWMELSAKLPSPNETLFEARIWNEGEPRPEKPVLQYNLNSKAGFLRAATGAAPYALKPVYIDQLEATAF